VSPLTGALIAAAAVALWAGLYGVLLAATRVRTLPAAPSTPDLGTEPHPPALVNLLATGWQPDEDGAEATLLDLAARGYFEIRQGDADPAHSTIHLRDKTADNLQPYEWRVLRRVRAAAVGGAVPLTALTFRDRNEAKGWRRRFRAEVVAHARTLGLSRRRLGPGHVTALTTLGVVAAVAVSLAIAAAIDHHDPTVEPGEAWGTTVFTTLFGSFLFGGLSAAYPGERDTAAGRTEAARWLGVRRWLADHERFGDLPPAAVAVWDRYLGYGAALGVTHVASAAIDLGMGSRTRVWSSLGGWHRVRVRYPRWSLRYGHPTRRLVEGAVYRVLAGAGLVAASWFAAAHGPFATPLDVDLRIPSGLIGLAVGVGLVLVSVGLYRLARAAAGHVRPREITGEVLWMELWRSTSGGEDRPPVPWLYYLAVDDGSSDRTVAWGLPAEWRHRCSPGDQVRMTVHPWSRRVVALATTHRGGGYGLHGHETSTTTDRLVDEAMGVEHRVPLRRRGIQPDALLTAEEVGAALGMAVTPRELGPVSALFVTADRGRTVLMVQLMSGTLADLAWKAPKRGTQVAPDVFAHEDGGAARTGDVVVTLTLHKDGRRGAAHVPWLLGRAVERISARTPPPTAPAR
jgi:hypothetical protein